MRLRRRWEPYEFNALATFNAERARGIVHTPEWCERMQREQERFDQQQRAQWLGEPNAIIVESDGIRVALPDITNR